MSYHASHRKCWTISDVGRQCVSGSVHDSENARIGPDVVVVRVEPMNFVATTRPKSVAQGGHARE